MARHGGQASGEPGLVGPQKGRGVPPCFAYEGELKDLHENGVYEGEINDLGEPFAKTALGKGEAKELGESGEWRVKSGEHPAPLQIGGKQDKHLRRMQR